MNRAPLKRYAPRARRQFIQAITDGAARLGLSASRALPIEEKGDYAIVGARVFPREFAAIRARLEAWIARDGFEAVVEEVAYTWFNRLMAIRFMEVNGFLSHPFLVLGRAPGASQPQLLVEAENVSFPGLDAERVTRLKIEGNRDEELYRLLLLEQCHELHRAMPFLFEPISDESELLLPDTLLQDDSLISTLVAELPEELWREIEIIGWLYQFYISEKKDEVIGSVVASPDIPAATQLFTPNWIVKYLTQNSLGRQWLASYPGSPLRAQMDYYIEPAPQSEEVRRTLAAQMPASLELEALSLLDPACGSGHILVEAYDLFKLMYLERGYRAREVPRLVLEHNLFGLDIDPRAAQMAGFALLMKGRADDRRLLDPAPRVRVHAVRDSRGLVAADLARELAPSGNVLETSPLETDIAALLDFFLDADTFGSLLQVPATLEARLPRLRAALDAAPADDLLATGAKARLQPFVDATEVLARKYSCVVANPPYMGSKYQTPKLKTFLKKHFNGFEKDLFSAFIVRCLALTKPNGNLGFMSPFVWMFISSYEELRRKLIDDATISTLVQLEYSGFDGATVPICTFTLNNSAIPGIKSSFIKLSDFRGSENQAPKTLEAIKNHDCGWFYEAAPEDFEKIPGSPIAYWASDKVRNSFDAQKIADLTISDGQTKSGDNGKYLRQIWEVDSDEVGQGKKWMKHPKGGEFRRWFGNVDWVINWSSEARVHYRSDFVARILPEYLWGQEGFCWTLITSAIPSFRKISSDEIFNLAAPTLFLKKIEDLEICLGFVNTKIAAYLLNILNPTLNMNVGEVQSLPLPIDICQEIGKPVSCIVQEAVSISRTDWDSFETSWDFARSPLLGGDSLETAFKRWQGETLARRARLRELETENNRLFIHAYGLESELSPDVPDEQITLARADREGDVRRLVSYALGCAMGRYCLDEPGLIFAGSEGEGFDPARYGRFPADADGILPVTDALWFEDEGATRVAEFVRVAFGDDLFPANLAFLAGSLGPRAGETSEETLRRYLAGDFYRDHLRAYRNRPIYWLFSSGKERAFGALVYLHRMNASTLPRLRSNYVLPLLGRLAARIEQLDLDIQTPASPAARRVAEKERAKRARQLVELNAFDEKLRHRADERWSLDLDDGVRANYAHFGELLAEARLVTGSAE